MKKYNVLGPLYLFLGLIRRSDHILGQIYAEMQKILKGSQTSSRHCMCLNVPLHAKENHWHRPAVVTSSRSMHASHAQPMFCPSSAGAATTQQHTQADIAITEIRISDTLGL